MASKSKLKKEMKSGTCALTGLDGPFVKSHIIPAALTRLPANGQKIVEAGIGLGKTRRFVSWYDDALVTRVGEDILEAIDTPAIEILREHKLIWSSWEDDNQLITNDLVTEPDHPAYRLVRITRARELQLFFLSVAWRSAATLRREFSDVNLSDKILNDLRWRVLAGDPGPSGDYPVHLFQTITKGTLHNRTPRLEKKIVELENGDRHEVDCIRIYFDGLVAYVYLELRESFDDRYLGTCLRSEEDTVVFAHEFNKSRTARDIQTMVSTVIQEEMEPLSRLTPIAAAIRHSWRN